MLNWVKKYVYWLLVFGMLLFVVENLIFAVDTVSAGEFSSSEQCAFCEDAKVSRQSDFSSQAGGARINDPAANGGVKLRGFSFSGSWESGRWTISVLTGLLMLSCGLWMAQLRKEQSLKDSFSQQLLESQESERKRIAAELHDGLGQHLLIIKNQALLALTETEEAGAARESLRMISEISSQAIQEARQIAYALRPYQIDRFGLTVALRSMLRRVSEASDIRFRCEVENLDALFSKEAEMNLYRIVQESLNNILKHSRATEAEVSIFREENQVRLRIADNGTGMPMSLLDRTHIAGFGLTGMAKRARILNGQYELRSASGQGTIISLSVPVPKV